MGQSGVESKEREGLVTIMTPVHTLLCLLLAVGVCPSTTAISCFKELSSLTCLPVYSHYPDTREKCYCTSKCPNLETLVSTCSSGQLHQDPCGVCLQCAPGPEQTCGGFANSLGVCAGGLNCLIKYSPVTESEHNKTGICVTETNTECKSPKTGVSCRPGQLGVLSDFVFCPRCPSQVSVDTSTVTLDESTSDSTGSSDSAGDATPQSNRRTHDQQSQGSLLGGSLVDTLGILGQRVREAVMDTTGWK